MAIFGIFGLVTTLYVAGREVHNGVTAFKSGSFAPAVMRLSAVCLVAALAVEAYAGHLPAMLHTGLVLFVTAVGVYGAYRIAKALISISSSNGKMGRMMMAVLSIGALTLIWFYSATLAIVLFVLLFLGAKCSGQTTGARGTQPANVVSLSDRKDDDSYDDFNHGDSLTYNIGCSSSISNIHHNLSPLRSLND